MKVRANEKQDTFILELEGELDASSSVLVYEELDKAIAVAKPFLLINCNNLSYISSTGLGVFISQMRTLRKKKIKLILYGVSEKIKNVFAMLGLQDLIPMAENQEAAFALCQPQPVSSC